MGHKKGNKRKRKLPKYNNFKKGYKSKKNYANRKQNNNHTSEEIKQKIIYENKYKGLGTYLDIKINKKGKRGNDPIFFLDNKVGFIKGYSNDEINEIFGKNNEIISNIEIFEDRKNVYFARIKED